MVGLPLRLVINMIDLEQEYQELMRSVIDRIHDKAYNGDFSPEVAEKLQKMVEDRAIYSGASPEEPCPHGHDYACGWSHSMGYHCA